MYQANIDNGAELQYALFDQPWLLFTADQQDNPQQVGNSINCRGAKACPQKIQINKDAQGFNQMAIS